MGILDTQKQADALCTVIALGFVISSKDDPKKQSYIFYQEGENSDTDYQQHLLLQNKLASLTGSADLLTFKTQSADDKPLMPIILAQTDRSNLQSGIADDEKVILNQLEGRVNKFTNILLRGAYVGGLLSVGSAELLDPSILYWYESKYRTFSPGAAGEAELKKINKACESAQSVTETVRGFLQREFPEGQTQNHREAIFRQPLERPLSKNILDKPTGSNLFASIHGMTQSIIHYFGNADPDKINIELALSKDTCKVASCIPCSLFMWSNGTPATATHFGRGDNWNFPSEVFALIRACSGPRGLSPLNGYPYAKNWMEHIWKAYDAGKKCLETRPEWSTEELAFALQVDRDQVPQMFLEALTFESSFLKKMLGVLEKVPPVQP